MAPPPADPCVVRFAEGCAPTPADSEASEAERDVLRRELEARLAGPPADGAVARLQRLAAAKRLARLGGQPPALPPPPIPAAAPPPEVSATAAPPPQAWGPPPAPPQPQELPELPEPEPEPKPEPEPEPASEPGPQPLPEPGPQPELKNIGMDFPERASNPADSPTEPARGCKQCRVCFLGATCPESHANFMYTKKLPPGARG